MMNLHVPVVPFRFHFDATSASLSAPLPLGQAVFPVMTLIPIEC